MASLKDYRKEMGATQQQVADMVGISRESYNALELGKAMPSLVVADKLACLFRVTVYELFTLESRDAYEIELDSARIDGKNAAFEAIIKTSDALLR